MNKNEIESLSDYLNSKLSCAGIKQHIEDWLKNPVKKLLFEVVALYDKGLGAECMTLPTIEAISLEEAQEKAETNATEIFWGKFGKKTRWDEVKIRPK